MFWNWQMMVPCVPPRSVDVAVMAAVLWMDGALLEERLQPSPLNLDTAGQLLVMLQSRPVVARGQIFGHQLPQLQKAMIGCRKEVLQPLRSELPSKKRGGPSHDAARWRRLEPEKSCLAVQLLMMESQGQQQSLPRMMMPPLAEQFQPRSGAVSHSCPQHGSFHRPEAMTSMAPSFAKKTPHRL